MNNFAQKYMCAFCWRRALIDPACDLIYYTLAGARLAARNTVSRPDHDVLDREDLWPPLRTEQPQNEKD
jgi:hypothetical protein